MRTVSLVFKEEWLWWQCVGRTLSHPDDCQLTGTMNWKVYAYVAQLSRGVKRPTLVLHLLGFSCSLWSLTIELVDVPEY